MNLYFCTVLTCVIIAMTPTARVAAEQAAISQKVELLWPLGAPGAKGNEDGDKPTLTIYLPPNSRKGHLSVEKANRTAVVICPGGGYGHLAMDHEGHQIAQ